MHKFRKFNFLNLTISFKLFQRLIMYELALTPIQRKFRIVSMCYVNIFAVKSQVVF